MKEIARDFCLIVTVPDDVSPDDCEIVVDKWSASYVHNGVSVAIDEKETELHVEDPYEMD